MNNMKVIIMAGGKGTRLSSLTNNEIPKPLVKVAGKPILAHQLDRLHEQGISEVTLVIGHLKEKIVEFIEQSCYKQSFKINYIMEEAPLGTAGALYYVKDDNFDDCLIVFGDTIFDIDINRMYQFHLDNNAACTLFTHPNSHPNDSDLLIMRENKIVSFDSKNNVRDYIFPNSVNAGFYILNKSVLQSIKTLQKLDLDKDIIRHGIDIGLPIYGYKSSEYIKDVGTIERIEQVEADLAKGIVKARNLANPQKCIFLDRDGTINKYLGFIKSPNDIYLIDGVAEAIKLINTSGYLAIVVSNQPVIARGEATFDDVRQMHEKIEMLISANGAYIDDFVFCPHHPDKGFAMERPELKIVCRCRKPNTLMIEQCIEKYNIDKTNSWIIGDTIIDIQTGKNANLHTAYVRSGANPLLETDATINAPDLLAAVKQILESETYGKQYTANTSQKEK